MAFPLSEYLARVGVSETDSLRPDLATLTLLMQRHSNAIAFENLDVVLRQTIDIDPEAVFDKLVKSKRGGYCFEQNILLQGALSTIGFKVKQRLCRVRWNKVETTPKTHLSLCVEIGGLEYIADVGFAGTNSIAPICVDGQTHQLPDGAFRVSGGLVKVVELWVSEEWRPLYDYEDVDALKVDVQQSNWWSCTHPTARFTTTLFAAIAVGKDRHHLLNDQHVVKRDGKAETTKITDVQHLRTILLDVFGVNAPDGDLGRFLYAPK
ncbi:hypothetical protein M885DRAFT_548705 [Pelagophyceae sp. CCMP2097]|nr:hypothetical protein M885DRAFT_548705 [Pelagophyceae sp. CCMP2097]